MKIAMLAALATPIVTGQLLGASVDTGEVDAIIKNLDLTTFRNSTGPRRVTGKRSFADYGFVRVEKTASGANLVHEDDGWVMSFSVVSAGPRFLRLCFQDRGQARQGDAFTPSYKATSALLVSKALGGRWGAKEVPAGFAECKNDPAAD